MRIDLTEQDDTKVLEAMRVVARQLRRKNPPAAAITAGKIELAFSKALDEIQHDRRENLATAPQEPSPAGE